ncbi:MAG: hypothetical protein HZB91_10165 [Elusimicrobia bacterium]|nr:hypothetical protein [Elusimicrobiota bacterium]
MSRGMRWFVAAASAGLAFVFLWRASAPLILSYLSKRAACSQPCAEPTGCQPVSLELELARPWAKARTPYALWYRMRLLNQSCFPILVQADCFYDEESPGQGLDARQFSLTVRDSKGKDFVSEHYRADGYRADGTLDDVSKPYGTLAADVIPYQMDRTVRNRLLDEGRINGMGFITLAPGEFIVTQPAVLDPYSEVQHEVRFSDGGFGTSAGRFPAPAPLGAETPPPGFRVLNYYFPKPGRYTIVATYRDEELVSYDFPRYRRLPQSVGVFLSLADFFLGTDTTPDERWTDMKIDAVSKTLDFEVRP